ncbi:Na(+)-translocating NADH-quinone reductase subunit F [Mesonia sp. K7]|uniref:Na(+)-translocating NADH-quinone reductase subunit F n=1 Tax=Mesonia sp. K7 TaxID=2218606 RepID=UPI000DA706E4|nr:Na(+)-translocating NADH-quinone reductase subunit F [Mesonia sp. K7]PZD77634.1 Na(+)-translocating NADH-quinone reductase subunit F [Mesonia sp. K7]
MQNPNELTEQELHNLAMNVVGEDLKSQGFDFLAVNSKLKKNPQFVVQKGKQMSFVLVRAICFPEKLHNEDKFLLDKVKAHAQKFDADLYYAEVGLGHAEDMTKALVKGEPYSEIYQGLKKI